MNSPQKHSPQETLQDIYLRATSATEETAISDAAARERVEYVCRCTSNRAGVRLLMACLLAKLDNPSVDPRKPYTEIGTPDSFSGRTYDEQYLSAFINSQHLPCNQTTAFLTPTFRNISETLSPDKELVGRPRELYKKTLLLLDDVAEGRIKADILFVEVVRILLRVRDENQSRLGSLLSAVEQPKGALPLSSEAIITLIGQHLACKNASRLPVLIMAAAYRAVGDLLGEQALALCSHNAADLQTGSIGDVEIRLAGDDAVVTAYEMKMKPVTIQDIDAAVKKILKAESRIQNYIFVTTCRIDSDAAEYACQFYEKTGGTEIVILDCLGFLKHFLHFFHRLRSEFLDTYQELVVNEPDSAVRPALKEAFLALRQAAETGD